MNSNNNGKIEKDTKHHTMKNRHIYKSYLRLVPTSDGGRHFLVAGDTGFEGSACRSRPSPARGYCWGSPPRVPEVALDCRTEAEGTEGHHPGRRSSDAAEGLRMKPKVLEARRSLRRPEASGTLQRIKRAPEGPELIRRLQRTFGIASRARIG